MKKYLVFRSGALGDMLLSLPALRSLAVTSRTEITLVTRQRYFPLFLEAGLVTQCLDIDSAIWAPLFNSLHPLPSSLKTVLSGYDGIVYWLGQEGDAPTDHFRQMGFCPAGETDPLLSRWYIAASPKVGTSPAGLHFLNSISVLPIPLQPLDFKMVSPQEWVWEAGQRMALPHPYLTFHPGSGSPAKNWPWKYWLNLANGVMEKMDCPLVCILGEAEAEDTQRTLLPSHMQVAREWPLTAVAGLLAGSSFHVGHDTGISHLAALVGCPCLLLFGPTDPATWAPQHAWVRTLRTAPDLESLAPEEVTRLLLDLLSDTMPGKKQ